MHRASIRIFKKVLEAHEILSDPELCQVENQLAAAESAAAPLAPVEAAAEVDAAAAPTSADVESR